MDPEVASTSFTGKDSPSFSQAPVVAVVTDQPGPSKCDLIGEVVDLEEPIVQLVTRNDTISAQDIQLRAVLTKAKLIIKYLMWSQWLSVGITVTLILVSLSPFVPLLFDHLRMFVGFGVLTVFSIALKCFMRKGIIKQYESPKYLAFPISCLFIVLVCSIIRLLISWLVCGFLGNVWFGLFTSILDAGFSIGEVFVTYKVYSVTKGLEWEVCTDPVEPVAVADENPIDAVGFFKIPRKYQESPQLRSNRKAALM